MSNRSLLEFNHDHCPRNDAECLELGKALQRYMRAAHTAELPQGVVRKHYRHHSDPDPMAEAARAVLDYAALDALLDSGKDNDVFGIRVRDLRKLRYTIRALEAAR